MKRLKQNGFTHLEVALIILVVLIIGAVGFYVFKKSRDEKKPVQTTTTTTQVNKTEAAPKTKTNTQKYLEIPEQGVKIPLDSTISDAYYYIRPGYPNYAYLSVRSLENTDNCAAGSTGLGVLAKGGLSEEYNPGFTYKDAVSGQSGKVIGDHAYVYTQPQATCFNSPTQQQTSQAQAIIQAFRAASKNIEAS